MPTTPERNKASALAIISNFEKAVRAHEKIDSLPQRHRKQVDDHYKEARGRLRNYLMATPVPRRKTHLNLPTEPREI